MLYIIGTVERRREVARIVASLTSYPLYSVEIKPYKRNRSLAQNRTMHMWYRVIADHLGCQPEEVHEQMKVTVLGVERKIVAGQALIVPKSTTELNTEGMSRFMEAIIALAADLDVTLPMPDDLQYAMEGAKAA